MKKKKAQNISLGLGFFSKSLSYPKHTLSAHVDMLLVIMIVSSFISQKYILHLQKHHCLENDITLNGKKPDYSSAL